MMVKDYLENCGGGPVRSKDLARRLGFPSVRQLQKEVEAERRAGALILSDPCGEGYFISTDPTELRRFVRTLHSRARNTVRSAEAAQRALDELEGQMRMEGI